MAPVLQNYEDTMTSFGCRVFVHCGCDGVANRASSLTDAETATAEAGGVRRVLEGDSLSLGSVIATAEFEMHAESVAGLH